MKVFITAILFSAVFGPLQMVWADNCDGLINHLFDYLKTTMQDSPTKYTMYRKLFGDKDIWKRKSFPFNVELQNTYKPYLRYMAFQSRIIDPKYWDFIQDLQGLDADGLCRGTVYSAFNVDDADLSFSYGKETELCQDSPNIIWDDSNDGLNVFPLNYIFNWNVDALLCSGTHLVFGLSRPHESTSISHGIAFWQLDSGKWWVFELSNYSKEIDLSQFLHYSQGAKSGEDNDAIFLTTEDKTIVFWPSKKEWAIVDTKSGKPIKDSP